LNGALVYPKAFCFVKREIETILHYFLCSQLHLIEQA